MGEPRIGRMRDRLLLHGGVNHHALEIFALIAPVRCATERLSCSSAAICSSPSRCRQRVNDERSNGASWRNATSPQKY